ncbi:hypothetical protein RBWH47_05164 [Rhodopirellula baltica WH47]|uniref:Uncharacterized protein n=2 Tax=Rhodopirellula baltica TaxID=265606 RepID=F2APF9_RHOBT|nr:hypothetical protein RBWH47_05164 [Rhodopirellula baltica WH47]ELP29898.1 hypothetical protein RBSWK_06187 [Rhodopirellula baltica SWK14]
MANEFAAVIQLQGLFRHAKDRLCRLVGMQQIEMLRNIEICPLDNHQPYKPQ